MPVLNPLTGETRLLDTDIIIIMTARAWIEVESALGRNMMQLLASVSADNGLSFTELAVIIQAGQRAWALRTKQGNKTLSSDEVLDLLDTHGLDLLADVADAIAGSPALGRQITATVKGEGETETGPLAR